MSGSGDIYLVWSHEHGRWWGSAGRGYVQRVSAAGRYTRETALTICANAIPGTASDLRALPEIPVRLADLDEIRGRFREIHGDLPAEAWE